MPLSDRVDLAKGPGSSAILDLLTAVEFDEARHAARNSSAMLLGARRVVQAEALACLIALMAHEMAEAAREIGEDPEQVIVALLHEVGCRAQALLSSDIGMLTATPDDRSWH